MNRLYDLDLQLCIRCNRFSSNDLIKRFFSIISRLGDGVLWYSLMLVLPLLYGQHGLLITAHMLATALPSLLVYRYLKTKTLRPRPCAVNPVVHQCSHALDQFSFPSGHTLHAVGFTIVICGHIPGSAWLLVPFATLVALSRPILGLHYPSDVLAGAAIGVCAATGTGFIPVFS